MYGFLMNALQEAASPSPAASGRPAVAPDHRGGGGVPEVVFQGEASGAAGPGVRLRLLFGGATGSGGTRLLTGRCFGVLGAEATHAGRRIRSWVCVARLGGGSGRVPGVDAPVELLAVAVQPRSHHRPGPVAEWVALVAHCERAGVVDRVPARFWLSAGAGVAAGQGTRLPSPRERVAWSLGR